MLQHQFVGDQLFGLIDSFGEEVLHLFAGLFAIATTDGVFGGGVAAGGDALFAPMVH